MKGNVDAHTRIIKHSDPSSLTYMSSFFPRMWLAGITPTSQRTNRDVTLRVARWHDLCHEITSIPKDFGATCDY